LKDVEEMKEIIEAEREDEKNCMVIRLHAHTDTNKQFGVRTRSGLETSAEHDFPCAQGKNVQTPQPMGEGGPTREANPPMDFMKMSVDTTTPADAPCDFTPPNSILSEGSNKRGEECTPPNFIPHENVGSVWERDWGHAYASCPTWGGPWKIICGNESDWPQGFKRFDSLIYQGERLCVPTILQQHLIRSHHDSLGH
jgi:hypothetical protein